MANLVWELRPPQVLPRLEKRLFDAATPTAQRGQIVDIVASSADVSGGKVLLTVLQNRGTRLPRARPYPRNTQTILARQMALVATKP